MNMKLLLSLTLILMGALLKAAPSTETKIRVTEDFNMGTMMTHNGELLICHTTGALRETIHRISLPEKTTVSSPRD